METKYSYECLTPQFQSLRFIGYYQIDPRSPQIHKFLHKIYMRISLIWIFVFTILEIIKMFMVHDDKEKLISILFLFLTHTDSIYKQAAFWLYEDKIEKLLDMMRSPIFNQNQPEHKAYFQTITRHGYLLLRSDNLMAILTCFLWALNHVLRHLQNKTDEFGFWVPLDTNEDLQFYFITLYQFFTHSWQAFGNTTMDVLISFLFAQCQIQLRILRTELTKLVQRSKLAAQQSNESYEQVLKQRFEMQLYHHRKILDYAKSVETIFSGAIFYQFLVGGSIVCTSVYRMVNLDPASMEFLSMMAYMYCILIEIFLYCYYGNELTKESDMLTEAIYSMDWLEMTPSFRKNIIILMERIKRSIEPLAGNIIPISNNTFVKILKSSYSLFTLLKASNE